MSYEQNEWIVDMDDAQAPIEEPEPESRQLSEAEFAALLEECHRRQQVIKHAHTSWTATRAMLEALGIKP